MSLEYLSAWLNEVEQRFDLLASDDPLDTESVFSAYYNTAHECEKARQKTQRWTVPALTGLGITSGRVLSAGCGNGADVATLRARGFQAVGVDLFKPCGCAHSIIASIAALPFYDEAFDAVICLEVIEHISRIERPRAYAGLLRVLKPGGWVIIATPNRSFPIDEHGTPIRIHSPWHDYTLTIQEVERELGCARILSGNGYFAFERFGRAASILSRVVRIFDKTSCLNPHLFLAFRKDMHRMS